MYYLVTDQFCKTWRGHEWGPDVTHSEDNPNHLFAAYSSAAKAMLMYPAYEDFSAVRLWEVEGEPLSAESLAAEFGKIKVTGEVHAAMPTSEQQIAFAISCSLMLVNEKDFQRWCHGWLRGEDRSAASAVAMQTRLTEMSATGDYFGCAHACLLAVTSGAPALFAANCAHRAYYDSPPDDRLDLDLLSSLATTMDTAKLSEVLAT